MHRIVVVAALFAILAPAPGAAEPVWPVGKRVRLATVGPQENSSHADPARVVREDANSITLIHSPGNGPITRTKEDRWLIGKVVAADERRLALQVSSWADPVILRREDITSLAVSEGGGTRAKSAWVGGVIGAGAGVLMGFASGDDPPEKWFGMSAEAKAAFGALSGATVGTLIGLAISPAERWKDVPTDRIRLSLAPVQGCRAAVSLRLAF